MVDLPSSGEANERICPSEDVSNEVLRYMSQAALTVQRLADLEYSGRVMATFMRGHMLEVQELMEVPDYMARFYDDVAQEYIQLDDEDFTIHHCLRTLFREWQREGQGLDTSDFGRALRATAPDWSFVPGSVVRTAREPIADEWYLEVTESLMRGRTPESRGVTNPLMRNADCVLEQRPDLIFAQFMIWCGRVWGRQVVVTWDLLRSLIALHRTVRVLSPGSLGQLIEENRKSLTATFAAYGQCTSDWAAFHSETVTAAHDPLFAEQFTATRAWRNSKPEHYSWRIKDAMKDEMYLEVFLNVQALRNGRSPEPTPDFTYWRQTPWTPESLRKGAPGMPPFIK